MSGPFYFAWCDPATAFDAAVHCREDEKIFSFTVSHTEGDFAVLEFEIKNPKIGLLAPSRKRWCWLSWRREDDTIIPLFYGQLVGVPDNIFQQVITVQVIAKPINYTDKKKAAAAPLKVLPYYDPIFIAADSLDDPDTVLEGYSRLWHIDRVTHDVTTSDIIAGEDGTLTFSGDDILDESVSFRIVKSPWLSYSIAASVSWYQQADGELTIPTGTFVSLIGQTIIQEWPKTGANLGGGWSVKEGWAVDISGAENATTTNSSISYTNRERTHRTGDTMSVNGSVTYPSGGIIYKQETTHVEYQTGVINDQSDPTINIPMELRAEYKYWLQWVINTRLVLSYAAKRQRVETVNVKLTGDFQRVLVDTSEDAEVAEAVTGADVGENIAGEVPIGRLARRSYFPTARGIQSLEYVICLARARMLAQARGIEVEFEVPFEAALAATLRKNARINYAMLPGGTAVGKIIEYAFGVDGSNGASFGRVKIGCCLGKGQPTAAKPDPGDTYVDDYADDYFTAEKDTADLGELWHTVPVDDFEDDGIVFPLNLHNAVVSYTAQTSGDSEPDINDDASGTGFALELRSLTAGPWQVAYAVTVSPLTAPCGVDLEALPWD